MSNIISTLHNATQVVNAINSLTQGILSTDDNATQFVSKVNAAMSVGISLSDNATDIVSKINLYEESASSTLRFLHISDAHDCADSFNYAKTLLQDSTYRFIINTGDYSKKSGGVDNVDSPMKSIGNKFLCLNGNHDVYNTFGSSQSSATTYLKTLVTDPLVVWGDSNGVASYWYRDFSIQGGGKVRVFAIDQYDYRGGVGTGSIYDTIYTLTLVNWFIDKLLELNETDYIIIATHEPVINSTIASGYSYNVEGKMDSDCVAKRRVNDFCSSRLWIWDSSLTNSNLWPIIIDAYTNKKILNETVNNTNSLSGNVLSSIVLLEDFSNISPAKFLFYLGGHLHGDMVSYHPTYPQQLIMLVDNANSDTLGNSSDIRSRSNGIMMNDISIDFINQLISVSRIGNNAVGNYNGFSSMQRTSISFPIVSLVRL